MKFDIFRLRDEAQAEAYEYFDQNIRALPKLPNGKVNPKALGLEDNDVDAFRHAYVSGVFTQVYGESVANLLGVLNELTPEAVYANAVDPRARDADLWNNRVGRKYGKKAKNREKLLKMTHEALKRDELVTDPSDPREYQGKTTIPKNSTKPVIAVIEDAKGRNELYYDTKKRVFLARDEFVAQVESGNYPGCTVRSIKGIPTPVSNPDGRKKNNIG